MIVDIQKELKRLPWTQGVDEPQWRMEEKVERELKEWGKRVCSGCGMVACTQGPYLIWGAIHSEIVLCRSCCETILNGLSRDMAEILGYAEAAERDVDGRLKYPKESYGVMTLLRQRDEARTQNLLLLRRLNDLESRI